MSLTFIHEWVPGEPGTPVFLLLHGTGGDERDLMDLAQAVYPGAGMLGLRGKVSENGANRWFRRLAEGIFDQEDLARRTSELRSELELVPQLFGLGDRQVVALGYSNGANMAANLLLSGFSGFAGAILLRPMVPGEAVEGSDLHGQAILITSGQMDSICPPGEGERLSEMLVALKANVQFELVPAGHNLTQQDLRLAQSWMNRLAHTSSH